MFHATYLAFTSAPVHTSFARQHLICWYTRYHIFVTTLPAFADSLRGRQYLKVIHPRFAARKWRKQILLYLFHTSSKWDICVFPWFALVYKSVTDLYIIMKWCLSGGTSFTTESAQVVQLTTTTEQRDICGAFNKQRTKTRETITRCTNGSYHLKFVRMIIREFRKYSRLPPKKEQSHNCDTLWFTVVYSGI